MRVGFLGYGKIGKNVAKHVLESGGEIVFVQDPFVGPQDGVTVITEPDEELYEQADLVIECATSAALKESFDAIMRHADLLCFSLTAFADEEFFSHAHDVMAEQGRTIFIPHGAILGLDGIRDGRDVINEVSIVTTKSPKSLGLSPDIDEVQVVFDGCTREACEAFPRNVNVHAAVALAGIGFDNTRSKIVADPTVSTNAHVISVKGEGIEFEIHVSSFTTGGVTGVYTPLSACGAYDRIAREKGTLAFI